MQTQPADLPPTMRLLPPLNALRSFEVVARHSNFTTAAEELLVSPSAVSQQIKTLEDFLGVLLFNRTTKSVELTQEGEEFYPAIAQAFSILTDAVSTASGRNSSVSVSTSTSFAMTWLMYRFKAFESKYPNIAVYLNAAPKAGNTNLLNIYDIQVAYSSRINEVSAADRLLNEYLLPVCAPTYAQAHPFKMDNIAEHRILLNSPDADDWRVWLKHHGVKQGLLKPLLRQSMALPTDADAIEMAVGGYGIALANLHYIFARLEDRLLVPAFDVDAFLLGTHYLKLEQKNTRQSTTKLIEWLRNEAANSQKLIEPWLHLRKQMD